MNCAKIVKFLVRILKLPKIKLIINPRGELHGIYRTTCLSAAAAAGHEHLQLPAGTPGTAYPPRIDLGLRSDLFGLEN